MTSLRLNSGLFPSTVTVPRSKSYANRALILSALAPHPVTLTHLPKATDVTLLISALTQIGVELTGADPLVISGSFPANELPEGATISIGEGGTTARFLACMLLRGKAPYCLILGERLSQRPWEEFISQAKALGAKAHLQGKALYLQGPISFPASFEVDCGRTTQFATGFQLACAWSGERVTPVNMQTSESYWELTQAVVGSLKAKAEFEIPIDWSSASYPLAFGALNQGIELPGLHFDPLQADSKFLSLLKSLGALEEHSTGVRVFPHKKEFDVTMDVSDCLDLSPALVYLLAHINGQHKLSGVKNLQHKESDRLSELMKLLHSFDRRCSVQDDHLIIHGVSTKCLEGKNLSLPNDHRIVMCGALFLRHHSGGLIGPIEAVDKSYPGFMNLLQD
jgi:3-phosphoshikimate 1-carboxyvinyltransferase